MLTVVNHAKPLSLASPMVILVEYGELTLVVYSIKILDGYQMVEPVRRFQKTSRRSRMRVPPVRVPVEWSPEIETLPLC